MRQNDTGLSVQGVAVATDVLSGDEREHADRVRTLLAGEIDRAGGWISFERYMELALYAPGLGYYSAGARKLGDGGDFVTAPEASRLFGACVARQCREVLDALDGGSLLEIGAGTGRLAVDVLTRLESLGRLPEHYFILEVSADLRERQRRLVDRQLPHLASRVVWLDAPPRVPFDGVIIANEVLDALPVARFRWTRQKCAAIGVTMRAGELCSESRPADARMSDAVGVLAAAGSWEDGYVSEYCPRLAPWTNAIVASLRRGVALWFDYGLPRRQYYLPERHEGTLLCHFRHRICDDPFRHPGLQDITAWVDYTALAEACTHGAWELAGFTTQAFFLAGLGIDAEMRSLAGTDEQAFSRLADEAKLLMLPGAMGERFKAMVWMRGLDGVDGGRSLSGFALQDLRHTL